MRRVVKECLVEFQGKADARYGDIRHTIHQRIEDRLSISGWARIENVKSELRNRSDRLFSLARKKFSSLKDRFNEPSADH